MVSRVAYNVPTASYAVGGFKGCIQRSVQLVASSVAYPRSVQLVASKGCIQRSVQLVVSRVAYPRSVQLVALRVAYNVPTAFCAVGSFHDQAECERHVLKRLCVALLKACS